MLRQRHIPIFVLLCGLLSPTVASAQKVPVRYDVTVKDADTALMTEWYGVYILGKKVGYYQMSRTKVIEGGKVVYREREFLHMLIEASKKKSEIEVDQTLDYAAEPPFRLMWAEATQKDGKTNERITLQAKDKEYEVVYVVGRVEQKKKIADLNFTMADNLTPELWIKRKPALDAEIITRELVVEDLKVDLVTTKFLGAKQTLVNGAKVTENDVHSVNHRKNIVLDRKLDGKGRMIHGSMKGGLELEFRRETEASAKTIEYSPDLFEMAKGSVDTEIGNTDKLTGLILELKGVKDGFLPDGPRQSLVAKGDGIYHLCLGEKYGKKVKATEKEKNQALAETNIYPVKSPEIKALAKKAIGDAKTDKDKVKNLCKFVKEFIAPELSATMPKISDLLEHKRGDCKSYALLFTCLARAAGLPARQISGFVYMGDDHKSFGGHAWNEVVIEGYWVPVDASMNQPVVDATHISLGLTESQATDYLNKTFGKLKFKLVEVQSGN